MLSHAESERVNMGLEYISIQKGNEFLQIVYTNGAVFTVKLWVAILLLCLSVAIYIALYLLMGFGLRKMAIATKTEHTWLAFVPFARYYFAGKIVGQVKLFGKKMKNAGFWLMIVFAIKFALDVTAFLLNYLPLAIAYFSDVQIIIQPSDYGLAMSFGEGFSYEYSPAVYAFLNVQYILGTLLNVAYLFFFFFTFMMLFRKFNPRSHFMFTIIAFIGEIFGISLASIVVFTQRNRKPVNYNDFVKEQYMRMQGMYAPPRPNPPDNPFREFGGRGENGPGDPFAEFGERKTSSQDAPSDGADNKSKDGSDDAAEDKKNGNDDKNGGNPFEGF